MFNQNLKELLRSALIVVIAQSVVAYADIADQKRLVLSADDYMKQGEFQKALVQLQKARGQDSFELAIDQKMRTCQMRLGSWVSSEGSSQVDWIEVDKLRLDDVPVKAFDSLFHVAQGLETREDYETAQKIYRHIAERAPAKKEYGKAFQDLQVKLEQLAQNHSEVGEIFLKQGRFLKALEEFNRALYYKPQDVFLLDRIKLVEARHTELLGTYHERLATLLQSKDRDQAVALAERAFREFPDDKGFRRILDSLQTLQLGTMHAMLLECRSMMDAHRYAPAEAKLREALVEYPGEPAVNELLEEVRQKMENERNTVQKDSLQKSFARALHQENVGLATVILQNFHNQFPNEDLTVQQKKLDALNARQQKVQDFQAALQLARQALRDGQLSTADTALQNALTLDPESPVAKNMLSDVRHEQAKIAEVEENKHREVQKAQALVKSGQLKEAKKVDLSLTGAKQVDQEVKQVQRTIREAEFAHTPENDKKAQELFLEGIAKYRVGDYKEALEKWNQVIRLNPDHEQAKKYIANVKLKLARME